MRETICGLVLVALCGCGTMPTGGDAGPGDSGAARGATLAGTFPAAAISAGRFCGPQASPVGTARMTVALGATAGELLLTFGDTLDAGDAGAPTPGAFPAGCAVRLVLDPPVAGDPAETVGLNTTVRSVAAGQRCTVTGQMRDVRRATALNDGAMVQYSVTFGDAAADTDAWCVQVNAPVR